MTSQLLPFTNLLNAISNLEKCLNCTYCSRAYSDPYTLTTCGHTFCKPCISIFVSSHKANCPICNIPNWLNQSQPNRQLKALLQHYWKIRELLGLSGPVNSVPNYKKPQNEKNRRRNKKKVKMFTPSDVTPKDIELNDMDDKYPVDFSIIEICNEFINSHRREDILIQAADTDNFLVQNEKSDYKPELETRSLPDKLQTSIHQTDTDTNIEDEEIHLKTQTNNIENNINILQTNNKKPDITAEPISPTTNTIVQPDSEVIINNTLSQEIDINTLTLTQTNSKETSQNNNTVYKSTDKHMEIFQGFDNELINANSTQKSEIVISTQSPVIGKSIHIESSKSNSPLSQSCEQKRENSLFTEKSPYLEYYCSSLNLKNHSPKLISQSDTQRFPSSPKGEIIEPCASQSYPNTQTQNIDYLPGSQKQKYHTNTNPIISDKFDAFCIIPDSNKLTINEFSLQNIDNTPIAISQDIHESQEFLVISPTHTPNRVQSSFTPQIHSKSQSPLIQQTNIASNSTHSPDLLSLQRQEPSRSQTPVIEPVEEIRNIITSPKHTPIISYSPQRQDDVMINQSPIIGQTNTIPCHPNSPIHTPTKIYCPEEHHIANQSSIINQSGNTSPVPNSLIHGLTHPDSLHQDNISQTHTAIPTIETHQSTCETVDASIVIEDNSIPEPLDATSINTINLQSNIHTIIVSDDSSDKSCPIPEVTKSIHKPRQLYSSRFQLNSLDHNSPHNTSFPSMNVPTMSNSIYPSHHSQPSNRFQYNLLDRDTPPILHSTEYFQKYFVPDANRRKSFPKTKMPNELSKDDDDDVPSNLEQIQTVEQQLPKDPFHRSSMRQRLDIRKFSADLKSPVSDDNWFSDRYQSLFTSPSIHPMSQENLSLPIVFPTVNKSLITENNHETNNQKRVSIFPAKQIANSECIHSPINTKVLLPKDDKVEVLLTPHSMPKFEAPALLPIFQEDPFSPTCDSEDLSSNEGDREEFYHFEICHSQSPDNYSLSSSHSNASVVISPTKHPIPEEYLFLPNTYVSEKLLPVNGDTEKSNHFEICHSQPFYNYSPSNYHSNTSLVISPTKHPILEEELYLPNTEKSNHINICHSQPLNIVSPSYSYSNASVVISPTKHPLPEEDLSLPNTYVSENLIPVNGDREESIHDSISHSQPPKIVSPSSSHSNISLAISPMKHPILEQDLSLPITYVTTKLLPDNGESIHNNISHSQPLNNYSPSISHSNISLVISPTKLPIPEEDLSLPIPLNSEVKLSHDGEIGVTNDLEILPSNYITNSRANQFPTSLIPSTVHNESNLIVDKNAQDSIAVLLISPRRDAISKLSSHSNTSPVISPDKQSNIVEAQSLPPTPPGYGNQEDMHDFAIKDSNSKPLVISLEKLEKYSPSLHLDSNTEQLTTLTSPTKFESVSPLPPNSDKVPEFLTTVSPPRILTPKRGNENTYPQKTPPLYSQFSQMNDVLSLARELDDKFSKNDDIDSDTDSVFSLTYNSPKPNTANLPYISLTPKNNTIHTSPSPGNEMVHRNERFNSPLGISIFDYADMSIDESINTIPHFSPSFSSPPTLNPVKRRSNAFQCKKLKLANTYTFMEQQASRVLSPKKSNEISNFSNKPSKHRGKSRYKHRGFQAN